MSKKPERPELTDLKTALCRFAFPSGKTEASAHIRRLHWYVACRLVIEGGFRPEHIVPRPPLAVQKKGAASLLHYDPEAAKAGERTTLGGLKTKQLDVTVAIPDVGPALAVSLKGTQKSLRNLTNRMEEAAGDCTNLHMAYPALVYGFWHILRANEEDDPTPEANFELEDDHYKADDLAIVTGGGLAEGVKRYAQALERLSDREDLRDHPARYEACGLTLAACRGGVANCGIHPAFPASSDVLDFNRMFQRLYDVFDSRFVYQAPRLKSRTRRLIWDPASPFLKNEMMVGGAFEEMTPRVG